MRLQTDGTISLSPSDLSNHLACPHLTNLDLAVQRGELGRPHADDSRVDMIRRKGEEHEAAYLARLEARGLTIACMPPYGRGLRSRDRPPAHRGGDRRTRRRRHLPAVPVERRRALARVRRLPRAHAGRHLRARRHEARAVGEAVAPAPAPLLRRAGRAAAGRAGRARPRRERARGAGELPRRGVPGVLPAGALALSRCGRARGRDVPLAVRALRDLRLSELLPRAAGG